MASGNRRSVKCSSFLHFGPVTVPMLAVFYRMPSSFVVYVINSFLHAESPILISMINPFTNLESMFSEILAANRGLFELDRRAQSIDGSYNQTGKINSLAERVRRFTVTK
ncbi:uncharacterized protein LOC143896253 [Temnothorax americanus]|uniref:uncharacterized protein LOC143896253 n=1 Tax=Temnothorax americanus TaxID=1964332 RepID=UPI0040694A55